MEADWLARQMPQGPGPSNTSVCWVSSCHDALSVWSTKLATPLHGPLVWVCTLWGLQEIVATVLPPGGTEPPVEQSTSYKGSSAIGEAKKADSPQTSMQHKYIGGLLEAEG